MIRREVLSTKGILARGLISIYWSSFFRSLGVSTVGIFLPAFIYLRAYEEFGGHLTGVYYVLLFIVVERLFAGVSSYLVYKVIRKVGFLPPLFISTVLLVLNFVFLGLLERNWWFFYVCAVMQGVIISSYWIPRLSLNVLNGHVRSEGKEVGLWMIIDKGVAVLGPLVGGFTISVFGFLYLYIFSAVMIFLSILPLLPLKVDKSELKVKNKLKDIFKKDNRYLLPVYLGHGMDEMSLAWIWPLFSYLLLTNVVDLGVISAASTLVSMVGVWFFGLLFDKLRSKGGNKDEKVFVIFAIISSIVQFGKGVVKGFWGVTSINLLDKTVVPGFWMPLWGYTNTAAREYGVLEFFTLREMLYSLAYVVMSLLGLLLYQNDYFWVFFFILAGCGILFTLPIQRMSNKVNE